MRQDEHEITATAQDLQEQLQQAYLVRHGAQALLDRLHADSQSTQSHSTQLLESDTGRLPGSASTTPSSGLATSSGLEENGGHVLDDIDNADAEELRRQVTSELHDASEQIAYLEQRLRQLEHEQNGARPILAALSVPDESGNLSGSLPSPALSANSFDNYPFLNKTAQPDHSAVESGTSAQFASIENFDDNRQQQELVQAVIDAERLLETLHGLATNPSACVRAIDDIVNVLKSNTRVKLELELDTHLPSLLRCLSDKTRKEVRANVYRLLRHMVVDQHDVEMIHSHRFEMFLIRTFARDAKFEMEKEQALKLVRTLMVYSVADANRIVPVSVIRAVVSIAENTEDRMRLAALETLGELLLRDVSLLAHAGGMRVVLQALSEGPFDLSPFLTQCFIYIMDNPGTRQYLRPGVDVEVVLSSFTEINVKGFQQEERVRVSARNTLMLLKSWSGLMYFNLYNRRPLRTLVESLTNPVVLIRDTLIDMFFSLFNVKTPTWYQSKLGRVPRNHARADLDDQMVDLGDQYLSIVLLMFVEAGFLEGLAALATKTQEQAAAMAVSLLISEVLQLANRVLPLDHAARAQALPKLFEATTNFDTSDARLTATNTLTSVDKFNRMYGQSRLRFSDQVSRPRSESSDNPLRSGQRQVEQSRQQMSLQIDDVTFRSLLLETGVLSTKEYDKWNIDMVRELVEGPLLNPKRLDEAMRASKFIRRLMGFFQPFQYRYSELRRSSHHAKYTQLGCSLLSTLLANPDGVRYLNEDKLLPQIADCLVQLDPLAGRASSAILLSRQRMDTTMVGGYFELLGTLSRHPEGLRLLNQFKIFSSFYRISELRGRDDLFRAVLTHLDYSRYMIRLRKFLATTIGVGYLSEIGFIHRMLDDWYYERNDAYVVQVELQLAAALGVDDILVDSTRPSSTRPPPHFYGELVRTEEGCNILDTSRHFAEFAEYLRQHAMEDFDEDVIFKLKSVLWAVGHVGSTEGGLEFVDEEDVLETIVDIAEESPVFSLRGTAFFALGLISSTSEGAEMLEDLGWQAVLTPLGQTTSLVVPMELGNFVDTKLWDPPPAPVPQSFLWPAPISRTERHVLEAISNLSNHILATKASKKIARIKQRHPHVFRKPELVARALELLGCHHYRSNVRKFVIEAFALSVLDEQDGAGGGGFWDDEFVKKVVAATDRLDKISQMDQSDNEDQSQTHSAELTESRTASSSHLATVTAGDSGRTSDADTGQETTEWSSSSDGQSSDDEKSKMPIKVMKAGTVIKGFLLS
ncbi:hypothetical protein OIV83_003873 [Microbotryomycetes sp. JL201]|nr:hypothetical protein OIV83_003873 [Microbotryomycetes sp. JL201]